MTATEASSKSHSTISNALLAVGAMASQQGASLVMMLLAARFLPLQEYGTFMLAVVFVELATVLTYSGFFHFTVRADEDDGTVQSSMFWAILIVGAFAGGLMIVAAPWLAHTFKNPDLKLALMVLGGLQPIAAITAWASACLTRKEEMRTYFSCLAFSNLTSLTIGAAIIVLWPSLFALLAYRAFRVGLSLVIFCSANRVWPRGPVSWSMIRQAMSYSSGLYGTRLVEFVSNFGTDLMLAYLFSTTESGLYRLANRLATASIDLVAQPMRSFALKSISAAKRLNHDTQAIAGDFFAAGVVTSGVVAVVAMELGPAIVKTLLHTDYHAAIPVFYVLCLRSTVLAVHRLIEPLFAAQDLNGLALRHHFTWLTILSIVSAMLAPYGLFTLAVGQAAVAACTSIAAYLLIKRRAFIVETDVISALVKSVVLIFGFACFLQLIPNAIFPSNLTSLTNLVGLTLLSIFLGSCVIWIATRMRVFPMAVFSSR